MAIGRFGVFLREYSFQKGKEDCWKNTLKAEAIRQQPSTFASENLGHRQPRHSKTKRKIPHYLHRQWGVSKLEQLSVTDYSSGIIA